ncbi:MAG: hypothetical protein ACRC9L_06825 [Brevinema sp.]
MGNKIMFFGKNQPKVWDQNLMHQYIRFVDGDILHQEMREYTDIAESPSLKLDMEHPIYKKIGGVRIETGWLQLKKANLDQCISLLNDFVAPTAFKEPQQNLQALLSWAAMFGWSTPSANKCAGYILNRELIRFEESPKGSCVLFKFKDDVVDIFLLYRVWFLVAGQNYFFLIQKTY